MFPLKSKIQNGYKFGQFTFYGVKHKGTDYQANFDQVYLPFDGTVSSFHDFGGGNWLRLVRENGDIIEFAHLSQYKTSAGFHKAGELAAISGNTGAFTTNPHLHIQITVNGKLVDPESYDWYTPPAYNIPLRIKLVFNNQPDWKSLTKHAYNLISWFYKNSGYKIIPVVDWVYVNLPAYDFVIQPDLLGQTPVKIVKQEWFDQHVMPLAPGFDAVILVMPKKDLTDSVINHPELIELGYAYKNGLPMKAFIALDENDDYSPYYPDLGGFAKYLAHELMHNLYTVSSTLPQGFDYVHNHFYGQNGFEINPAACFKEIDYEKLSQQLA